MSQSRWPNSLKGLGLLEVLLTIAVISIIAILSVNYYSKVQQQQDINYFVEQVIATAASVNNYYRNHIGQTNYAGIMERNAAATLVQEGMVKKEDVTNIWRSPNIYDKGPYYAINVGLSMDGRSCLSLTYLLLTPAPFNTASSYQGFCNTIFQKLTQAYNTTGQNDFDKESAVCNQQTISFVLCIR